MKTKFSAEQVSLLYAALPIILIVGLTNSTVLVTASWSVAPAPVLIGWYGFVVLSLVWRFRSYLGFLRTLPGENDMQSWGSRFLAGSTISGFSWGAAAYFLIPYHDYVHQFYLVFLLVMMSAIAVIVLSAMWLAVLSFVIPIHVSLLVLLSRTDILLSPAMVAISASLLTMALAATWRLNNTHWSDLKRRFVRGNVESSTGYELYFDPVTGLPTRYTLLQQIMHDIERCARTGCHGALFAIGLDCLKEISESLGHKAGDTIREQGVTRLKQLARRNGTTIACTGPDTIAVLIADLPRDIDVARREANDVAMAFQRAMAEPFEAQDLKLHMKTSVGCTVYSGSIGDADEAIRQAELALCRARSESQNLTQFYLPSMQDRVRSRLRLESDLRDALSRGEMHLVFQPQVDVDRRIVGAEALLRWQHPFLGAISPGEFIPIAERTGMIVSIGEWVLDESARILSLWQRQFRGELARISVNVSPRQLAEPWFVHQVDELIEKYGLFPNSLELEITEGMLLHNIEDTAEKMGKLSALGVRFAIDDFGTGYSSIRYLKELPLHTLKIDQSFVRSIHNDRNSAQITSLIIALGKQLNLDIVAEGVESPEEGSFLIDNGCAIHQGYLYYKPITEELFLSKIENAWMFPVK